MQKLYFDFDFEEVRNQTSKLGNLSKDPFPKEGFPY